MALVAAAALGGCSAGERRAPSDARVVPAPDSRQAISIALPSAPSTLDPGQAGNANALFVQRALNAGLTRAVRAGEVELDLARSITTSKDGRSVTILLRDGLEWSDGKPLTANDVVDAWRRNIDPRAPSPLAFLLDDIEGAREILSGALPSSRLGARATSPTRIVVTLVRRVPWFDQLLSTPPFYPVPARGAQERGGLGQTDAGTATSGPFVLVGQTPNALRLERNDRYWNADEVLLERVDLPIIADTRAAIAKFEEGAIDGARHTLARADLARVGDERSLRATARTSTAFVALSVPGGVLTDVLARRAVSMAIDRRGLIEGAGVIGEPASAYLAPWASGYEEAAAASEAYIDPRSAPDVGAARALLERSGWDERTRIRAFVPREDQLGAAIASAIRSDLQAIGVELDITLVQEGAEPAGQPDVFLSQVASLYSEGPGMFGIFTCSSGNNPIGYCNESYDELVAAMSKGESEAQRNGHVRRVEAFITGPEGDAFIAPLYNPTSPMLLRRSISVDTALHDPPYLDEFFVVED